MRSSRGKSVNARGKLSALLQQPSGRKKQPTCHPEVAVAAEGSLRLHNSVRRRFVGLQDRLQNATVIGLFLAGNVDLERRRHAMHQPGRDFVLAHNLDRLGELNAPLIHLETLSGERLRDIAGRNGTE